MSSLLSIGTSALAASQAALNTAGHNIANVNTAGYSRQSVVVTTRPGDFTGNGYFGKGVDVTTVTRSYNDFQTRQVGIASAISASDAIRYEKLSQLEQVFPTGSTGLGTGTNQLLNSFTDVSLNPTDLSARSVVLARADELAARFRTASSSLDEIQNGISAQMKGDVASINSISTQIAAVNQQIANAKGSGQPPNDLLDLRDQMVRDLNKYVQTSSINAPDGSLTIMIAGGQPLVLNSVSSSVTLKPNKFEPAKQVLYIRQSGQDVPLEESSLGGGEMTGLLKFQNTDLQQAKDQLWKMALTVGDAMNKQNSLGIDLRGAAGGNLFNLIPVVPATSNIGSATLDVSVNPVTGNANPTALVRSDYQVTIAAYNAVTGVGSVNIKRLSDGTTLAGGPFAFSNPPAAVAPVTADGLDFQITNASATLAVGDSFTVRQSAAASTITTAITAPAKLAMANPVLAIPSPSNTGTLALESLQATQTNAKLSATVTLTFDGNGGYKVAGAVPAIAGTVSYYPGQPIAYNGWSLTLKGTPAAGDTMTVQANGASIASVLAPQVDGKNSMLGAIGTAYDFSAVTAVGGNNIQNTNGTLNFAAVGALAQMNVDGIPVTLNQNYADMTALATDIQTQLGGTYTVTASGNDLKFTGPGAAAVAITNTDVNALAAGFTNTTGNAGGVNQNATFNVDGTAVNLSTSVTNQATLVAGLNTALTTAFGAGVYVAAADGAGIKITHVGSTAAVTISAANAAAVNNGIVNRAGTTGTAPILSRPITGPLITDSGNAKAILNLRDTASPLFGSAPISDIYANILSDIGIAVQGGKTSASISKSLVTDAEQSRASISGVNLDEEAAKLIQYQQAYQASGKILQVSQTIFDTLLQMVR